MATHLECQANKMAISGPIQTSSKTWHSISTWTEGWNAHIWGSETCTDATTGIYFIIIVKFSEKIDRLDLQNGRFRFAGTWTKCCRHCKESAAVREMQKVLIDIGRIQFQYLLRHLFLIESLCIISVKYFSLCRWHGSLLEKFYGCWDGWNFNGWEISAGPLM